ncbi:conserved hypothetical protein [Pediculus humanus corporis]|uniref:Protein downstream neighbor of Son n=1 Tax=Pediculus humanus subsp. corporis TaxID=121224 RepID=E0W3J2_PEDHC|nr:uncharacterized protein Phum_PHUM605210 [Pediculus humanus corporis]EEB20198.1 conserved hypothetical protein [Pediculus humanus corporis]
MKYYKLKQKKRALSSRMNGNDHISGMFSYSSNSEDKNKPSGKIGDTTDESGIETDISNDSTIFMLLNNTEKKPSSEIPNSFANILQHLNQNKQVRKDPGNLKQAIKIQKDGLAMPIDWSLKNKLRIMSPKSFSCSASLKTCEEACSITGFIRCLDACDSEKILGRNTQVDVTNNAKFHQCCLYWQHPNIPWLSLFPRISYEKVNSNLLSAQLSMTQSLITEWTSAFKSLYQLVRVNKCPYFYVIANHFYCLFRAAGMAGIPEIHAMITPTTRGFRKLLDDEGITYTMPLKKRKSVGENKNNLESITINENEELSGDEDWLESLEVDAQQIKILTKSQKSIDHAKERLIDGSDESLVLVQGMEIQSFFNVLVNCKSCIANTGPYTGIPPTLLAPTGFLHGTLKSCKIRDSMVQVDGNVFHSIQVDGPVLPHGLRQMANLLNSDKIQYSISVSSFKQMSGFTQTSKLCQDTDELKKTSSVFFIENLGECGLPENLLKVFCDSNPEMVKDRDLADFRVPGKLIIPLYIRMLDKKLISRFERKDKFG